MANPSISSKSESVVFEICRKLGDLMLKACIRFPNIMESHDPRNQFFRPVPSLQGVWERQAHRRRVKQMLPKRMERTTFCPKRSPCLPIADFAHPFVPVDKDKPIFVQLSSSFVKLWKSLNPMFSIVCRFIKAPDCKRSDYPDADPHPPAPSSFASHNEEGGWEPLPCFDALARK